MHRPLTRATAVSTAAALSLSLLFAPPVAAEETDEPPADSSQEDLGESDARALAEQTQHFANSSLIA